MTNPKLGYHVSTSETKDEQPSCGPSRDTNAQQPQDWKHKKEMSPIRAICLKMVLRNTNLVASSLFLAQVLQLHIIQLRGIF